MPGLIMLITEGLELESANSCSSSDVIIKGACDIMIQPILIVQVQKENNTVHVGLGVLRKFVSLGLQK